MNATATRTATGTCPSCGFGIAADRTTATCPSCSERVTLRWVTGTYSDRMPCDDRCQYAIGPTCQCNCGGENHSVGYIATTEVPTWVRERDAARHAAKIERARAKAAAKRATLTDKVAAFVAAHPVLAPLAAADYDAPSDFLASLSEQLRTNGTLSDRQVAAAERAITRDAERAAQRAARDAEQAAARAAGTTVPTGRVEITATIAYVRSQPGYAYNSTEWKALLVSEQGWKVWLTLPRAIIEAAMAEQEAEQAAGQPWRGWSEIITGRTMTVTATVTAKDDDPLFGIGKSPKGARLA